MIIARGAFEIRVRFVVGTRRRSRRTREMIRINETAANQGDAEVWPPNVEIGPAFIAERVAVAHALRQAEIQAMFWRFIASFKPQPRHREPKERTGFPLARE